MLTIPKESKRTRIPNERRELHIGEDGKRIPYVKDLIQIPVFSTNEAVKILEFGQKNRQSQSNNINANSSRSHAVYCMKIVSKETSSSDGCASKVSINQLSFCDLVGIECLSNAVAHCKKKQPV